MPLSLVRVVPGLRVRMQKVAGQPCLKGLLWCEAAAVERRHCPNPKVDGWTAASRSCARCTETAQRASGRQQRPQSAEYQGGRGREIPETAVEPAARLGAFALESGAWSCESCGSVVAVTVTAAVRQWLCGFACFGFAQP
jgi:hypothetical protein